jgi:hypothetical protein
MLPDRSKPPQGVKEQRGKIWEDEDGHFTRNGELTSLVCHTSNPTAEGLCYFHQKYYENYFDTKYPLEGKVCCMGAGGLQLCSIVEHSSDDSES